MIKRKLPAAALAAMLTVSAIQPAHALFGVGDVVLDPSNLAQNVLTATRTLQMVNNQIIQLTNEAQMLLNQARHLQHLDFNALSRLRATLATTDRLMKEAQGLAFTVSRAEQEFARLYPTEYFASVSRLQIDANHLERWSHSREALGTTMRLQAQATENFADDESVLTDLITQSQSAVGALQAAQATNQLLALQSRQLMQSQQLQIVQDRAIALEHARAVAAEERARELRARFMSTATTYTAEPIRAFRD